MAFYIVSNDLLQGKQLSFTIPLIIYRKTEDISLVFERSSPFAAKTEKSPLFLVFLFEKMYLCN
jgi:hypothetical protein